MTLFTPEQEQRSPAWHEQRKKRLGGSEIASVMGTSPYKSRRQLWLEKTGQVEQVDISNLPHVRRGIDAEPRIQELVEAHTGRLFPPRVFVMKDAEHFACSLDGYCEKEVQSAEYKTMGLEKHKDALAGIIPDGYKDQCQWNMMVSKTRTLLFASFRPEWDGDPEHDHEKLAVITVNADPVRQKELYDAAVTFWHFVTTGEDPGHDEADLQWVLEKEWLAAAARYREIKAIAQPLEKELKELDKLLKSRGPVMCGGLKVEPVKVKGTIDFENMPQALVSEVEKYRKPDKMTLRITMEKGLK